MAEKFEPHINISEEVMRDLTSEEVDERVANSYHAAYGEEATIDTKNLPEAQNFSDPLRFETEHGEYFLHASVHGDIASTDQVLIKTMPWSDDPLRGFEMLRSALIAGEKTDSSGTLPVKKSLAVIGVSLPGMGLTKHPLKPEQHALMSGLTGSFSDVAKVQWQAVRQVAEHQLEASQSPRTLKDIKFVIAGSSMGSGQAVELLSQKPEDVSVEGLLLIESLGLRQEPKYFTQQQLRRLRTMAGFLLNGSQKFKAYTAGNAYNQYPQLGPSANLATQIPRQVNTHALGPINVLAKGGDVEKVITAVNEHQLVGLPVKLISGSESKLSPPELVLDAGQKLHDSKVLDVETTIVEGHYHAMQENLANAEVLFRSMLSASNVHAKAPLHR